ncbi:MAG TPA: FliM/FliN family flagellar motor C-terminal domain-containing protein [Thermoanaerobaculaceae bacterium]|nr:FliM/FliN family flagellar motor C-terminal domain-containing protein [Thermoanaerobaculaceae bacterium]HRS14989.1 FliM/FliN family flagellar motor C-terminal domain-containing protein [Thermoanaerobaculaceae bacterium]
MARPNPLEPPTHPLGIAVDLVLELDVGVTTAAALRSWGPGDVLRLPALKAQPMRLRAGRHLVAEGEIVEAGGDRTELRITRLL